MAIAACKSPAPRVAPPADAPHLLDAAHPDAALSDAALPDAALPDAHQGITFSIRSVDPPTGHPLATRCALAGPPVVTACSSDLAIDRNGTLYVVDGEQVRRYKRVAGDDCRFDPAGPPIALPADNPRPQVLGKGPIYMRSGGARWTLTAAGTTVYAVDYLGGLVRIDSGRSVAACADVFGYATARVLGGHVIVRRRGIEQLALGSHCSAHSAGIDDAARDPIFVARDHVYVAGDALVRYDGKDHVPVAEGVHLCSVRAVTPCGDGVCVADLNCQQLVQLDARGAVVRTLDYNALFAQRPFGIDDAVTAADGTVYIQVDYRVDPGKNECEAAVYELPPTAF